MISLYTLNQHSLREIFDQVVASLREQGFLQSMDARGTCAYRGEEGMRCALGHLMSDREYRDLNRCFRENLEVNDPCHDPLKGVEGVGIQAIVENSIPAVAGITNDRVGLCADLQRAHDRGDDPGMMKASLRAIAQVHGWTDALPALA